MRRLYKTSFYPLVLLVIVNCCMIGSHVFHLPLGVASLIFFLLYPGYLLLKLLRLDALQTWVKIATACGLSITLLSVLGLLVNTLLPALGYKTPLNLPSVIIMCNALVIGLVFCGFIRGIDTTRATKLNRSTAILSVMWLLPLLAAGGAIRLNNGASNSLSLFTLFAVTTISIFVFFNLSRYEKHLPYLLYIFSLTLLTLWSLRSYHLSGSDIGLEHYVFQLAYTKSRWLISSYRDPYNACLSITILPVILSHLSNYSGEWILKLWYPILFALITPIMFIYFQKLKDTKTAYLASLFFCTQSIFILWMPSLARQEIAFLFFGLIVMLLFGDLPINTQQRKTLFYIFSIGLILSHYSTAYVTFVILLFGFIIKYILTRIFKKRAIESTKRLVFIGPSFLLIFLLFTFMWQLQITSTGGNLPSVIKSTVSTLAGGDSNDKNGAVNKVFSFNPFNAPDAQSVINLYKQNLNSSVPSNGDYYPNAQKYNDEVVPVQTYMLPARSELAHTAASLINAFDSILVRLALPVGLIIIFFNLRKNRYLDLLSCSIALLIVMVLFVAFPFISTVYNIERLYQQALMILSLPIVLGLYAITSPLKKKLIRDLVVLGLIYIFFWYNTGITAQLVGGQPGSILNNSGYYYDQNYTTTAEVDTIQWLSAHKQAHIKVYADKASERVLISYGGIINIDHDLFPDDITKNSYVYLGRSNVKNNELFQYINSNYVILTTPKDFLGADKNTVFATNQTQIYR